MGSLIAAALLSAAWLPAALPPVDHFADRHASAPQDAAVVVGIEKYFVVDPVPYAARDAQAFWNFLVFDRGVPADRISFLKDAAGANDRIEREIEKRAREAGPGGILWFYFAGHGAPDPSGKDGLLVGVDAQQTLESVRDRSVSRRRLLGELSSSRARGVVVVLDACFSGKDAGGRLIAKGFRPLIPTAALGGLRRGAVLTAARSDQMSGPLDAAGHGLFTYFLLGALRGWGDPDPEGPVTVESAFAYVRRAMGAALANGDREQVPDLSASQEARSLVLAHGLGENGPDLAALATGRSLEGEEHPAPPVAAASAPAPTAGPAEPSARFEIRPGSAVDRVTRLTWQRAFRAGTNREGLYLFGLTVAWQSESSGTYDWQGAFAYCRDLGLDGGGWRLPTLAELKSLLDLDACRGRDRACIDPVAFPGAPAGMFWSSSDAGYPNAWLVSFVDGSTYADVQKQGAYVRCVR